MLIEFGKRGGRDSRGDWAKQDQRGSDDDWAAAEEIIGFASNKGPLGDWVEG